MITFKEPVLLLRSENMAVLVITATTIRSGTSRSTVLQTLHSSQMPPYFYIDDGSSFTETFVKSLHTIVNTVGAAVT